MIFLEHFNNVLGFLSDYSDATPDSARVLLKMLSAGTHAVHSYFEPHDGAALSTRPSVLSPDVGFLALHDFHCRRCYSKARFFVIPDSLRVHKLGGKLLSRAVRTEII